VKISWMLYDRNTGEVKLCETLEDALAQVDRICSEYGSGDDAYPDDGEILLARVTHRNVFKVEDRAINHPCLKHPGEIALCSDCDEPEQCAEADEWEYPGYDECGKIVMERVFSESLYLDEEVIRARKAREAAREREWKEKMERLLTSNRWLPEQPEEVVRGDKGDAASLLLHAVETHLENIEHWLRSGVPASPEKSFVIYEMLRDAAIAARKAGIE